MFEACLHLVKPSEADELVHVLVFEQEAWPPASGLLRAGGQLLMASHLGSSAEAVAGANEHFKCRHDRRGPRASRSHAHRAEGVGPNRLTFTADGGLARRSRYPLLVRSHLTRQLAGRIDGLVSRVVAEGSRPRPPAAHLW